jgi:hypothetical protein
MYYDRSNRGTNMVLLNILLNLITQNPFDIAIEIVDKLNAFLESKNKPPRVDTMNYENSIYIFYIM